MKYKQINERKKFLLKNMSKNGIVLDKKKKINLKKI